MMREILEEAKRVTYCQIEKTLGLNTPVICMILFCHIARMKIRRLDV